MPDGAAQLHLAGYDPADVDTRIRVPAGETLFQNLPEGAQLAVLGGPGAHLDQADDAATAVEKLAERRYDLVFVDYYLPAQDGASFIAKLRQDSKNSEASVVAISVGGSDVREATLSAGADIFLSKPLVLRDLFQTLELLMAREDLGVA